MHRWIFVLLLITLLGAGVLPGAAQQPQPPVFATNTPLPPAPVISTPAAPINRFALRPWREADLIEALYKRVRQLTPGASELQSAIRLLQYELERRFPGAPRANADRERLLQAMLAAPPGSVDLRRLARWQVEVQLNQPASDRLLVAPSGFDIMILPANLDGRPPQDAVLAVRYTRPDGRLIYHDLLPAVVSETGAYRVLDLAELPAAPLGAVLQIENAGVGDFNADGLDELAVSLDDGQLNRELRIFGVRGGALRSLIQPGQTLRFGAIPSGLTAGSSAVETRLYREESRAWQCLGERAVTWNWAANFFRPTADPAGYFFQNTANCLFYGAEPLFAQPVDEALATLEDILAFVPDDTDYAAQRARMIQAMLHLFRGDPGTALAQALDLQNRAEPNSWLAQQSGAFITALGEPGVQPLTVCAALAAASPDGACAVEDALTRILAERPLRRDLPIADQLAELGITVQYQTTISQVGRANRDVVRFNLAGDHWWAFAPLDPEFYTAERIDPLPGFGPIQTPLPLIVVPAALYDALLRDNDPTAVLTGVDNLVRANPQAALPAEARYLQALSFDLLADRARARQAYYDLWQQSPLSIWGQLAAEHLEQR
jgi:hypothetical protein